ncbi:MAG: hypothetical protein LBH09_08030 [Peptococcaceae bacterium]|jgi:hypothetical protein|nr:hypothetical protein [Peptococcaceae bacterium]
MKFFLLDADDRMEQPYFLNWYKEMDPKHQSAWEIPRLSSFAVTLSCDSIFMDIVSYPYFMLSEAFYNLVRIYDEIIKFNYATLFDTKNRRHKTYGMPYLEKVDCLSAESELNRDGSVLRRAVLREETVRGRTLFQIGGVKNRYVAASLELVESAFRREVTGLRLRETALV